MVKRSGLGKGLEALIPSQPVSAPTVEISTDSAFQEIDISLISPNRYQPRERFDPEMLTSLSESIAQIGVIQPIIVRKAPGGYEIIAGERRWRAAQRAGLRSVPALLREADDKTALEAAVVENVHRHDLNALEEAAAYRQLLDDFELTQEEVASRVARSRSAVANAVRLLNLPPQVQRFVVEGHLSAGHGRALLSLDDENAQVTLAEEIVEENLTVRQAEQRAAAIRAAAANADPVSKGVDPDLMANEVKAAVLELENLLASKLDTRVTVKVGKNRDGKSPGTVTIEFSGLSDLERICQLMV